MKHNETSFHNYPKAQSFAQAEQFMKENRGVHLSPAEKRSASKGRNSRSIFPTSMSAAVLSNKSQNSVSIIHSNLIQPTKEKSASRERPRYSFATSIDSMSRHVENAAVMHNLRGLIGDSERRLTEFDAQFDQIFN